MKRQPRGFVPARAFIETGFSRRCAGLFRRVIQDREWMIVLGLPDDGKSFAYRRFVADYPVAKVDGITKTSVLATRVPHGGVSQNALMYRLGTRFGLLLPGRPPAFFAMLVNWTLDAEVQLIMIDDAHELSKEPRNWLRSFHDSLQDPPKDPFNPTREPITTGVVLLGNALRGDRTALFRHRRYANDLDWIQFERRLHFELPIVRVPGLDGEETGEALRGLEELYRPQFGDLRLQRFAESLHERLLDPAIDYAASGTVRMGGVVKVVMHALSNEAAEGGWGGGIRRHQVRAVDVLRTRPQELAKYSMDDEDGVDDAA
jgi:hypothetical protein